MRCTFLGCCLHLCGSLHSWGPRQPAAQSCGSEVPNTSRNPVAFHGRTNSWRYLCFVLRRSIGFGLSFPALISFGAFSLVVSLELMLRSNGVAQGRPRSMWMRWRSWKLVGRGSFSGLSPTFEAVWVWCKHQRNQTQRDKRSKHEKSIGCWFVKGTDPRPTTPFNIIQSYSIPSTWKGTMSFKIEDKRDKWMEHSYGRVSGQLLLWHFWIPKKSPKQPIKNSNKINTSTTFGNFQYIVFVVFF